MTTRDEIETRLLRAVEVAPSADGWHWLDEQVARVMARPAARRRGRTPSVRMLLRPLAVLAAFVLLTGAVGAGLNLLDRTVESSGTPGWQTAWNRAQHLDISETDAGVTITVERAYADRNQVLVGFTVAGLEPPVSGTGEPSALDWTATLTDPTGRQAERWATSTTGMAGDETGLSAVVQTWEGEVAPMAGTWVLTFSSVGYNGDGFVPGQCTVGATDPECLNPPPSGMIDGRWRFEFELPTPAGSVVPADVSDTVGQATLRLTELRVSPTMVAARIGLAVDARQVTTWSSLPFAIRHLDRSYTVGSGVTSFAGDPGEGTGEIVFFTTAGTDDLAGRWEIQIASLTYQSRDDEEIPLSGPWTLTVDVP
jgi:hypothetical protein